VRNVIGQFDGCSNTAITPAPGSTQMTPAPVLTPATLAPSAKPVMTAPTQGSVTVTPTNLRAPCVVQRKLPVGNAIPLHDNIGW
jgi:hypothetical protein